MTNWQDPAVVKAENGLSVYGLGTVYSRKSYAVVALIKFAHVLGGAYM